MAGASDTHLYIQVFVSIFIVYTPGLTRGVLTLPTLPVDATAPWLLEELQRVPRDRQTDSRLKSQDKTLEYRGPRLYNEVINIINRNNLRAIYNLRVEKFYITRFKKEISRYLILKQSAGGEEWLDENFAQ